MTNTHEKTFTLEIRRGRDLRYLAERNGYRVADIARETGLDNSTVSGVLNGHTRAHTKSTKIVQGFLARITGQPLSVIRRVLDGERARRDQT